MGNEIIYYLLSYSANFLYAKFLFRTSIFNQDYLSDDSYIFCPNHTCNLDGYIIWSVLSKDYEIDTFMYREFWEKYPILSKLLPLFQVYPITRDKLVISELKEEIKKLKSENHSLVIFPQGRHVDPQLMLRFPDEHFNTLPLGAFYFSAFTNKPIMPVFLEPPKLFLKNAIIYGMPLYPQEFKIFDCKGKIQKDRILLFARKWLEEINYITSHMSNYMERKIHPYSLHNSYFDSKGNHNLSIDPNSIMNDYDKILRLQQVMGNQNCDVFEAMQICDFDEATCNKITEIQSIYEQYLRRRK